MSLNFTEAERTIDSGIRKRWLDIPENTLPPIFYLPLRAPISTKPANVSSEPVRIRCARYERLSKGMFPTPMRGHDIYEYKGDL